MLVGQMPCSNAREYQSQDGYVNFVHLHSTFRQPGPRVNVLCCAVNLPHLTSDLSNSATLLIQDEPAQKYVGDNVLQ